ncbi:hypothetical protein RCL1_008246 [Eukaryota sp. TZLM3-RCL]
MPEQTEKLPSLSKYKQIKTIARGAQGQTLLVEDKKGNKLCVKIVHDASAETSPEAQMLLKNLDSPFLVHPYDCFPEDEDLIIIMEYLCGGSLHDFVQQQRPTSTDIWVITTQLIHGLHYLHERDIVHCNLKPRNVLLCSTQRPLRVKICDFGICRDLNVRSAKSMIGTVCFMAPEVLSGQRYDTAVDMWSLGILIYFLVHGEYPFNHLNEILLSEIPRSNSEFGPIISRLLVRDPASRATAAELIMDPKIVEIYQEYIKDSTIADVVDLRQELRDLKRVVDYQSNLIKNLQSTNSQLKATVPSLNSSLNQASNLFDLFKPLLSQLQREQEVREGGIEAQTRQEFISKGGVKFLASNKGSFISLSHNDLVATKTSANWQYENSFVAIQHPVKGKAVLTLLSESFYDFIGFFDPSYLQDGDCHENAHSLFVYNDRTQFYINDDESGPSQGPISIGQQVVIEFNNNQATFSVPSLGYSHIVTWPSGYVFGLVTRDQNTSWKLSSS